MKVVSGGMLHGSNWDDGFEADQADWEQTLRHLKSTVFKQKGIAKKIKDEIQALEKQHGLLKKALEDFCIAEAVIYNDLVDSHKEVLKKAKTTLYTATMAQILKDEKMEAFDRSSQLQVEIDKMTADSISSDRLPSALWVRVQQGFST